MPHIKKILIQDPQDTDWTAEQIVKLYRKTILDEGSKASIFNVRSCPECGSDKFEIVDLRTGPMKAMKLSCRQCKWGVTHSDGFDDLSLEDRKKLIAKFKKIPHFDENRGISFIRTEI